MTDDEPPHDSHIQLWIVDGLSAFVTTEASLIWIAWTYWKNGVVQ